MAFYIGIPSINIRTLRYLQEEYCERECPDCEGGYLTLHYDGDSDRLMACCPCGFQEEEDDSALR